METIPYAQSKTRLHPGREIGRFDNGEPGPLLICIGGIHGNEPAGVAALDQVVKELQELKPRFRGQLVGLAGNLAALTERQRFIDRDLNRQWLTERVEHLRSHGPGDNPTAEDVEQWELLTASDSMLRARRGHAIFLDLHTTSGPGAPFAIIEDTMPNRRLAFSLPIPVLLGLEEKVEGTFIDFVNSIGHRGVSVEGGQSDADSSIAHLRAVTWIIMATAGMVRPRDVPGFKQHVDLLAAVGDKLPRVLEASYRHGVEPDDDFEMKPGYASFSAVKRGETLAADRDGQIKARQSGHLLLPLYQKQGSDGFFVVRSIRPFWLGLASLLRRLRVWRWLHLLPGVQVDHARPYRVVIDKRIVRYYPAELFTLLGYRRQRPIGSHIVLFRRPQRLRHPAGHPPGLS